MLKKLTVLTLVLSITLGLFTTNIFAETPSADWYQIEYVVFEHKDSDRSVLRYEDLKYHPPLNTQYQYLVAQDADSNLLAPASPFQTRSIPAEQQDLSDAIKRLKRSREVRVFAEGAWQQSLAKESSALPLKIVAGRHYDSEHKNNARNELEGSLTVRRSRYIHVDVDLVLSEFTSVPYDDLKNWFFEYDDARWPTSWLTHPLAYPHPVLVAEGNSYVPNNAYQLKQSRRIKDEEIHYIDHPVISMIVTVKKIDDPSSLEEDFSDDS